MSIFDIILCIVGSLGIASVGAMWLFADGMDPTGQSSGLGGCLTTIGGLGMAGWLIWLLVR